MLTLLMQKEGYGWFTYWNFSCVQNFYIFFEIWKFDIQS